MTLTEFLLARVVEEEAAATDWQVEEAPSDCWDSERVLDECDVKRRIVRRALYHIEHDLPAAQAMAFTLRDIAVPYADHPDYREEWAPNA